MPLREYNFTNQHRAKLPKVPRETLGFDCCNNKLKNLEGTPNKVMGDFKCSFQKATEFSLIGGPQYVAGNYECQYNDLISLEGIAQYIGECLFAGDNKLSSLQNIHEHIRHVKNIDFGGNPIKSHVLGLFLIPGLTWVSLIDPNQKNQELLRVNTILNDHLPMGKAGLVKAQIALLQNGLDDYAKI